MSDSGPVSSATSASLISGVISPAQGGTGVTNPTANQIPVSNGTSNYNFVGPMTSGQILIGSTGSMPVVATPSNGTNVNWVIGAGTLTANITGPASATNLTSGGILLGNGSSAVTAMAVGGANTVLLGTGSTPQFGLVSNSALSNSSVTLSNGTNISITGGSLSLGGTATVNISGPPSATSLTQNGILLGNGSSAITAMAVAATNTVLLGNTGSAPSFGTVPNAALTNSSITVSGGTGVTVSGSPVSLGGTVTVSIPQVMQVIKTTGIKLISTGVQTLFTTSGSQRFYPTGLMFELTSVSGFVSVATISFGSNGGSFNNILAASALTAVSAVNNTLSFNLGTTAISSIAPSTDVGINVTIAATSTTYTGTFYVIGFYN